MTWLKLDPARLPLPDRQRWLDLQQHFHDVTNHLIGTSDWDMAALYRSLGDRPLIYYASPFAANLLLSLHRFPYEICERPKTGTVELMLGSSLANDTAWVELPEDHRPYPAFDPNLAAAQESDASDIWRDGEADDGSQKEGLGDDRH